MDKFLTSNLPRYRFLRTVFQGIVAWLIANLPQIIGLFNMNESASALLVPLIMAILSPVMAILSGGEENE